MKLANIKRKLKMPFSNFRRKRILYNNIMTPEEIQIEEKKYHEMMLEANRKGRKDLELEFMHKRDALRKVLKIG
jgi:hypothetical protein